MVELDSEKNLCVREDEVHVCTEICLMKINWPFWRAFGVISLLQFSSVNKRITKMFSVHAFL